MSTRVPAQDAVLEPGPLLSGKAALITGASRGIGLAIAARLGRMGASVAICARNGEALERAAAALRGQGMTTLPIVADVTRTEDVERMIGHVSAQLGEIEILVNNAGIGIFGPFHERSEADWDAVLGTNLKAVFLTSRAVASRMIRLGRGHIINISSFLSRVPMATIRSAYSASKAALNSLTANLRMDLAGAHPAIHVTLVMPGLVSTEFAKHALHGTPPMSPAAAAGAQTADEVAAVIVGVIDRPVAEVYTGPQLAPLARRYFEDVGAFERSMSASR